MLRNLLALLLLLPLAARAEDWNDGQGSGDDEYSWQSDSPAPGDPRDGHGGQDRYGPPADQYGSQQYGQGWQDHEYGSRPWGQDDESVAGPSIDDFRSGLDRYGRWVDAPEYGRVWQPTQVGYPWQPYWDGPWVRTTAPVRAIPIVEADARGATRPLPSGALPVWRPRTVPYSRPAAAPAWSGAPAPARAQPGNPGAARGWREQFPAASQPRPAAPAAQPVGSPAPPVRPPDARPAPVQRAEHDERASSGRPQAQPLNGAREPEKK